MEINSNQYADSWWDSLTRQERLWWLEPGLKSLNPLCKLICMIRIWNVASLLHWNLFLPCTWRKKELIIPGNMKNYSLISYAYFFSPCLFLMFHILYPWPLVGALQSLLGYLKTDISFCITKLTLCLILLLPKLQIISLQFLLSQMALKLKQKPDRIINKKLTFLFNCPVNTKNVLISGPGHMLSSVFLWSWRVTKNQPTLLM